jgi:hypothetical protein
MVDRSRLVLSFFTLCILITNPFNYLLNHIHSSNNINTNEIQSIISSRTLQSTIDNENFNSSSKIKMKLFYLFSIFKYIIETIHCMDAQYHTMSCLFYKTFCLWRIFCTSIRNGSILFV